MSASDMDRSIVRLAYQIVEENGTDGLGLIGVRRRGVPLAEAGPDHGHQDATDPRWAGLKLLQGQPQLDNEADNEADNQPDRRARAIGPHGSNEKAALAH